MVEKGKSKSSSVTFQDIHKYTCKHKFENVIYPCAIQALKIFLGVVARIVFYPYVSPPFIQMLKGWKSYIVM